MIAKFLQEKYILRSNSKDLYYTVCKFGSLNMASNMNFLLSDGKPAPWFYGEGKIDGDTGKFICFAYRLQRNYNAEETQDLVCFVFEYDDIDYEGDEEPECSATVRLGFRFPVNDKDCARNSSKYARTLVKKASMLPFPKIPDFLLDNDAYGHDWRKSL